MPRLRQMMLEELQRLNCSPSTIRSYIHAVEDFAKEDYELNLRCIKEDGGIIAARYLHWTNSHWTDAGGCAAYWTQLMELRCIKLLMHLYPGMIRRVRRGGSSYSVDLDF